MIFGNQVLGQKVRVEYFDQNSDFERCFPSQTCEVVRQFSSIDGAKDWFLLKLEQPFVYRESKNTHLLVRSRWEGYEIGGVEPTSVFILLIPNEEFLREPIDIEKFNHVAWGMIYPISDS
jgi:hypothetical protein